MLCEGTQVDLVLDMGPKCRERLLSIETRSHKVEMVNKEKLTMT
jgi:hypothetical protein